MSNKFNAEELSWEVEQEPRMKDQVRSLENDEGIKKVKAAVKADKVERVKSLLKEIENGGDFSSLLVMYELEEKEVGVIWTPYN